MLQLRRYAAKQINTCFLINKRCRGNRSSPAWLLGIKEQFKTTRGEVSKVLYMCIYICIYPFIINLNFRIYSKGTQQEYGRKLCRKLCVCVHTCVCVCVLSHVQLFVTLWTVASQAPLSLGFSQQEYCNGLPFPRDLHDPGIEPTSPILCISRQILYHWATWEAHRSLLIVPLFESQNTKNLSNAHHQGRDPVELTKVYSHSEVPVSCRKNEVYLYILVWRHLQDIALRRKSKEENNVQFTSISLTRRNMIYIYKMCNTYIFHSSVKTMAE